MSPTYRFLGALFLAACLAAQSNPGGVSGVVVDSSGALVPAASVVITGAAGPRSVVTQSNGTYSLEGLAPGRYTIKVAFTGFVPAEKTVDIAGSVVAIPPIKLTVAAEKQSVTVSGQLDPALSVEADNNATAIVIKNQDLDALPDDPDDLAQTLQMLAGPAAGPNGGQIYVDGFSGGQLPPKNAIREIRINQNPLSAEYDRIGFGRIDVLTKPGSDKFRGGIGMFDSDAFFNSRNPYATNKADYVNRNINANLSGPLGRKASFFLNFNQRTVNTDALINAITLDPASLAQVPVRTTVVTPLQSYNFGPRLDFQLTPKNTLTTRYQYISNASDNNGIGQYSLTSRAYSSDNSFQDFQSTLTSVLSATAVHDLRFEYSRRSSHSYGDNSVPAIMVSGSFNGGGAQVGRASNILSHYELQSSTSIGRRAHTVRFGFRARRETLSDISPANFGGTFTFFGVGDAPVLDSSGNAIPGQTAPISSLEQYRRTLLFQQLGDTPAQVRALGGGASQFSIASGNPFAAVSRNDLGAYIQDDWRKRPNLTISAGLRYETQGNLRSSHDFAPRLGIAWGPGARNGQAPKVVIRTGFGMFYDRVTDNLTLQQLRFNGINQQQFIVSNPDFFPIIPSLSQLQAGRQPASIYEIDKRLRSPFSMQGIVSVERQLPWRTTVAATYIGMHGTHVLRTVNINSPLPGTYDSADPSSGLRPYGNTAGNIFQYESNGVMNMQQFFVTGNTRFNRNVSLSLAYFRMGANTDAENLGMPSNPYNFKQDYGPASFLRRNAAQVLGSILGPFGLRFNPIVVAFSGIPYDLTIGHDLNGDTIASDRPAFATDLSRPSVVFTRFGAFDTNPMPGQTLVPRDYLQGNLMWNVICRVGRTFAFGSVKKGATGVAATDQGVQAPSASLSQRSSGPAAGEKRFSLNFNVMVNNVFNHLNKGGWVGNLASPLFGQSTAIYLQRETSNDRLVQFGTQLTF